MFRLALIDPLTLLGRETATALAQNPNLELGFFHSSDDDEHQIAQVAGRPELVPPLSNAGDLEEFDAIVLAAEVEGARLEHLDRVLENRADVPFLDMSPSHRYRHLTSVALDHHALASSGPRLHLAHPSLVVASLFLEALRPFEPTHATIAATDPISVLGLGAVEALARQAAQRLQGEEVTQRIADQVFAFNMAAHPAGYLERDSLHLFPEVGIAATFTMSGCFHGHLVHLGLWLEQPTTADDVVADCERSGAILTSPFPLNLDAIGDANGILMAPPSVSADGRSVLIQAMVDGTRVGGALTAAEIVRGMW